MTYTQPVNNANITKVKTTTSEAPLATAAEGSHKLVLPTSHKFPMVRYGETYLRTLKYTRPCRRLP